MYGCVSQLVAAAHPYILHHHGDFVCEINLEVKEKSVPLQSQMKNGWLRRP